MSTSDGNTTVTIERKGAVIVIKNVSAAICDNFGHYYLDEKISDKLLNIASDTVAKGVEVEVMHLKAS